MDYQSDKAYSFAIFLGKVLLFFGIFCNNFCRVISGSANSKSGSISNRGCKKEVFKNNSYHWK